MARFIREVEVNTVAELKVALYMLPDTMPVTDCLGETLMLKIYEEEGEQFMQVA